jgi:hypothetical protein
MMNWKGFGRKLSWSNLRFNPGICVEGLRKNKKKLSCTNIGIYITYPIHTVVAVTTPLIGIWSLLCLMPSIITFRSKALCKQKNGCEKF